MTIAREIENTRCEIIGVARAVVEHARNGHVNGSLEALADAVDTLAVLREIKHDMEGQA